MADLTSTISIQGAVGNQVVGWTHTATMTDIVDAGVRHEGSPGIWGYTAMDDNAIGTDASPVFEQASPAYLLNKNDASSMFTNVQMGLTGGSKTVELALAPGSCAIIMDDDGSGLCDYSATDTDVTLIGVVQVVNSITFGEQSGMLQTLTALKA